jgi:hypothetical protein
VLYGYSTWLMGNCMTSLLGPCSPCLSSHFVCLTRSGSNCNLLMSAVTALRLTIQGIITSFTNSIMNPQQKAIPPATQSRHPPPPWQSCSPVAVAHLLPPPQPNCRLPAGATIPVRTQATLTPPGLTSGKVTGQVTGCGPIDTLADPATTQATLTPPGLIPGKATGPLEKAREGDQGSAAAQVSIIFGDRQWPNRGLTRQWRQRKEQRRIDSSRPTRRSWGSCRMMIWKSWL